MPTSTYSCELPVSAESAFSWHERPGAFDRLVPPWQAIRTVRAEGGIRDGGEREMEIGSAWFRTRWLARHDSYEFGRKFRDVQVRGPFRKWEHSHIFEPIDDNRCRLTDRIDWAPPKGVFGMNGRIRGELDRLFRWRHALTAADLAIHAVGGPRLRVLVGGASGLVGTQLCALLTTGGHEVCRLVRRPSRDARAIQWDPASGVLDPAVLDGFDAVVHLGGASIAGGRWTDARKALIRDSRVDSTRMLAQAIADSANPPTTFIGASAIGYYGSRADAPLAEDAPLGDGFLADVCRDWEAAADPARAVARVVHARIGIVLSPQGGALQKMLTPFSLGLGGRVGNGRQYWPWIALDDVVGALHHILQTPSLVGPVNLVAPEPPTNAEFTQALARTLRRPAMLPLPTPVVRLLLGELGETLLLNSARVIPQKLLDAQYPYRFTSLPEALRHLLGKKTRS